MESSIRQRIKRFIEDKNISINALSNGNSALQRKLQRQINEGANVTVDTIEYLQNYCPQLNSDWLLRGMGEMYLQDNAVMLPAGTDGGIPFYDHAIECGTPADFNACIEADKADGKIMLPNIQGDFALVFSGVRAVVCGVHARLSCAVRTFFARRARDFIAISRHFEALQAEGQQLHGFADAPFEGIFALERERERDAKPFRAVQREVGNLRHALLYHRGRTKPDCGFRLVGIPEAVSAARHLHFPMPCWLPRVGLAETDEGERVGRIFGVRAEKNEEGTGGNRQSAA